MFPRLITACMMLSLLLAATGCSVTSKVAEGSYLLTKNVVEIDRSGGDGAEIKKDDIHSYIYQNANKRLLGTYLMQSLYMLPDSADRRWPARWARRIGREPILLDTLSTRSSALNIENYMTSNGYFDYEGGYRIDSADRKAQVTYRLRPGKPYRIGRISYDFRDKAVAPVILADTAGRLFRTGDIYSQSRLDAERSRIADQMKDLGYYDFTVNNITYVADSSGRDRTIDIRMVVRRHLKEYTESGAPVMENNAVYMIKEVRIVPDYDPTMTANERMALSLDTVDYKGLRIIYSAGRENVRREVLRHAVSIYPNQYYNASQVRRNYNNLLSLGYFRNASIVFTPVREGSERQFVSLAGAEADSMAVDYFICTIFCTPGKRYGLSAELEGSVSSSFYAISPKIGFRDRNLFKGSELFSASVWGSYEFMKGYSRESSYEIGGSIGITIPRFLTPIKIDRFRRLPNSKTKIDLSYSLQNRPYYRRNVSSASLSYSWSNGRHSSYQLSPIDVSLVKMDYIDTAFLNSLQNPYLRNSYSSQLIPGISGSFLYSKTNARGNSWLLRVNAETMGNTINALARLFDSPTRAGGDSYYEIFGIRFSQYVRADFSLSRKFALGERSSIVARIYGGYAHSYGNGLSVPYDRLFYSGGSYSMRGWLVRTLGPGNEPLPENTLYPYQVGNVKLEANLEARFPVWGIFNGAVFLDAGNVWNTRSNSTSPKSVFHWNSFYKQLGLNTGLGVRIDITFVILRIDWGIKLHDPNLTSRRWIESFHIRNTTLNFGVGYPF